MATETTGSTDKKNVQLTKKMSLDKALHHMLEDFMGNSESNTPVAQWSL